MGDYRMAKLIRIEQNGVDGPRVFIDGELLPYFTAHVPKVVTVHRGQLAQVTITLVAERVVVEADSTATDRVEWAGNGAVLEQQADG